MGVEVNTALIPALAHEGGPLEGVAVPSVVVYSIRTAAPLVPLTFALAFATLPQCARLVLTLRSGMHISLRLMID